MDIVRKRIQPWHTFGLPYWWYRTVLSSTNEMRNRALRAQTVCPAMIAYLARLSVCRFDKQYVEHVLQTVKLTELSIRSQWYALLDIGLALYDLGERERGIVYLEQAATMSLDHQQEIGGNSYIALWLLCSRLNAKRHRDKRLQYASHADGRWTANINAKTALADKYIGDERFDEARAIVEELVASDSQYSLLMGDFYYAQRDFQNASRIYDGHQLAAIMDFSFAQFDYRRVSAYYLTGQEGKWKKQAKRIGRRLKWDRFYEAAYLQSEDVERIPAIDDYILRVRSKWLPLDFNRLGQYVRRLPRVAWKTFVWYRYQVLLGMFGLGMLFAALALLMKLFSESATVPSSPA